MSSRFDQLARGQRLLDQRTWLEAELALKDMLVGMVVIRLIVRLAMPAVADVITIMIDNAEA